MSVTRYECQACGWIYPAQSESANPEPIAFNELPDTFCCPLCGVAKAQFKPLDVDETPGAATLTSSMQNSSQQCQDVVVVGAGLAGWTVIDALRAKQPDIGITLITQDMADRYHKPMLSVALSQNKTPQDLVRMSGVQAAQKANITLMSQTQVISIDSKNRTLQTDKGELSYGNLVLALGAAPAIPACFADQDIWHINDLEGFSKIQAALAGETGANKHIAVIGAGMIGTEIAEDLTTAGHKVTLLDINDAPLAGLLPPLATDKILQALHKQDITFLGGHLVQSAAPRSEGGYQLTIKNCQSGESQNLQVDHLLISTGLKVADTLPLSAGLDFDVHAGIIVDEANLQSSVPHIYAIGDCMSIDGVPCRYVAPLRAQAASIVEHILGQQQQDYQHQAYEHKPPMIRLKNKSISVSATGTPSADESRGVWQVISDTESDSGHELVLAQVADNGEQIAKVTLKTPH
uniref:FAD-dependent pyridine nucleotide-disulfide oxidoreductase n=1 Tax=Psychrobacter sp. (strain PRwf-1) TaxID=349106 RepID=A5WH60_PSYWF